MLTRAVCCGPHLAHKVLVGPESGGGGNKKESQPYAAAMMCRSIQLLFRAPMPCTHVSWLNTGLEPYELGFLKPVIF